MNPELVAKPSNCDCKFSCMPCPPPMRATNMKMPQNTPNAVSRLLVLFLVIVMRISSHVSISIFIIFQSALSASIGLMLTAFFAGKKPANVPAMIRVSVAWTAMPRSTVGLENMVCWNIPASMVWLPKAAFIHSVTPMPATIPI